MTASAPSGIGAPVKIRAAHSGAKCSPTCPAATRKLTGKLTPTSALAWATSCDRMAYPSIEVLSKAGTFNCETMSCASTLASASKVETLSKVLSGLACSNNCAKASSRLRKAGLLLAPPLGLGIGAKELLCGACKEVIMRRTLRQ